MKIIFQCNLFFKNNFFSLNYFPWRLECYWAQISSRSQWNEIRNFRSENQELKSELYSSSRRRISSCIALSGDAWYALLPEFSIHPNMCVCVYILQLCYSNPCLAKTTYSKQLVCTITFLEISFNSEATCIKLFRVQTKNKVWTPIRGLLGPEFMKILFAIDVQ